MTSPLTSDSASPEIEIPQLPFLTPKQPGIGGVIKHAPEDFCVEEIPAYEPSGEGEHLFLWIEKRDTAAEWLSRHLSRVLGVSSRDIGVAGLKDRRALTRQYVSVPAACAERIGDVETDGIHVLHSKLHQNKLRTGHSRGNRFSILVRNVEGEAEVKAAAIQQEIASCGFPNYFGPQRFGAEGETLRLGMDLLRREKRPRDIPASRRRFLQRLALSAAQSHLFNCALGERLTDGLWRTVMPGDVMQVAASGGPFLVVDSRIEQKRFEAGETTITGPLFGPKMRFPDGEPAERERRLLEACGLTTENFIRYRKLTPGARRACSARPDELTITPEETGLRLNFTLPRGVYATSLLREFQKTN